MNMAMTPEQKRVLARAIVHGASLIALFAVAWGAAYIFITHPELLLLLSSAVATTLAIWVLLWAAVHYE